MALETLGAVAGAEAVQLATRRGVAALAARLARARLSRLSGAALQEATEALADRLARQAERAGARASKRMAAAAAEGAMLRKVSAELAEEGAERATRELAEKALTKAATSGAARAVARMWNAVDLGGLVLDVLDVGGYGNFTPNADVAKLRDVLEAMHAKAVGADAYPMVFPIAKAFPAQFAAAMGAAMGGERVVAGAMGRLSAADVDALADPDAPDDDARGARVAAAFVAELNADPGARDDALYAELRRRVPANRRGRVARYRKISSADVLGVSLSEAGVRAWNRNRRAGWLEHDDVYAPKARADGAPAPDVALFAAAYRVRDAKDPGPDEAPNMVARALPERVALAAPLGKVVAMCEARRNVGVLGTGASVTQGVDPTEFGVAFDVATGACAYTRAYCARFGLDTVFDGARVADCREKPGTAIAEFFLPKTAVRAAIQGTEAIADTVGRALQCAPDERQFGLDCYEPCKKGYEYTQDVFPTCGRACPEGMRDDGTSCWQDTVGRGAGYAAQANFNAGYGPGRVTSRRATEVYEGEYDYQRYASSTKKEDESWTFLASCNQYWGGRKFNGKRLPAAPCGYYWGRSYLACEHRFGAGYKSSNRLNTCYRKVSARSRCNEAHGSSRCATQGSKAYVKCPSGYSFDGSRCAKVTSAMGACEAEHKQGCVDDEYHEGVARPKCEGGLNNYGMQCTTTGQSTCEHAEGKGKCEQCGLLWYPKCPAGYALRGCNLCEPPGGPGIKASKDIHLGTKVGRVHTCAPDQRKVGDGPLPCFPNQKGGD